MPDAQPINGHGAQEERKKKNGLQA